MTVVDGRSQYGRRSGRAPFQNTIGGFYGSYANFKPGGTLPSYYSVTRASVDYAWDGTQFVQVASGAPSFWYGKGLAVFGAATNLAVWSADISNAAWLVTGASKGAGTSIIQGGTGIKLVESASGGAHLINAGSLSYTTGTTYTTYHLMKAGERRYVQMPLNGSAFTGNRYVNFDLQTGTFSASGANITGNILPLGSSGWYLCAVTSTADATVAAPHGYAWLISSMADTYTPSYVGDGTSGIYMCFGQTVTGTRILPPIVTNAAPASRAADVISIPIASLPWLSASPAQLYLGAQVELLQAADKIQKVIQVNDGAATNRVVHQISAVSQYTTYRTVAGAIDSVAESSALSAGVHKAAQSVASGSQLVAVDGVSGLSFSVAGMPTGLSSLQIGHELGTLQLQGFIGSIYAGPTTQAQAWLNGRTSSSSY